MLIILWALCLSEHVYQCRSDFPPVFIFPLLCPVLDPDPAPQTLWTLSCLRRSLSRQAIFYSVSPVSKVWIMCLCCPHNCLVSLKYDRVTKCVEGRFTNFIDLDFKPLMYFKECINQRDWHQQAFHWVQKKMEPLKIARLCCNKLMEWDLLALPFSIDNIRNITNTAMIFHIHYFDWTKTKGKCSILDWVTRVFPLYLENQRKSFVLHIVNGFHSTPIFACMREAVINVLYPWPLDMYCLSADGILGKVVLRVNL